MTSTHPRVLVVEDSTDDYDSLVEFATSLATAMNVEVPSFEQAATGGDAVARLTARADDFQYIVLDLNLPDIAGIEVLRWARARPALRTVPVVILSSTTSATERQACLDAGANAFHIKHMDYTHYRETVGDLLGYWGRQTSRRRRA